MTQDNVKVLSRIKELVSPYVEGLGLFLWGMEIASGAGRPVVRIFIDGPDGVDVEHCASVSRQLSLALDMEDVVHGAFQLEVSSPGLDRKFFELSQLVPYVGQELDVTLAEPLNGRKRFKGAFASLDGETLSLVCEGSPVSIQWSQVAKAKLVYVFETPEEAKAKTKGKKTIKADKDASRA